GGNPVRIDGVIIKPFGLEKNMMPVAIAELYDLVLDGGTVTRPYPFDRAGIHGRPPQIGANERMCLRCCSGNAAFDLRSRDPVGHQGEGNGLIVCSLHLQRLPVDGSRSEEHTSELQSRENLVCRLLL